jgi:hypothetical protein
MHDKNLILSSAEHPDLRLRAIGQGDIENLRNWKNKNKGSFFLNRDILPEEQEKWYAAFSKRDEDYMFVVEQRTDDGWQSIGCMGFRKLTDEGCVDAYNIMRAVKLEPSTFTMSEAFRMMLAFADQKYPDLPIRCKVLCANPAVEWYKKNDFSIVDRIGDEYYLMELSKDALKNCNVDISNKK